MIKTQQFKNTLSFAKQLDQEDPLQAYQAEFHVPIIDGKKSIYFCGNSLGLQPKTVEKYLKQTLNDWATLGVEGHFHAKDAWFDYHKLLNESSARLVGAKPIEVVNMNTLTVNLHLMLTSFYRPTPKRYKILIEASAFPSDIYAVTSQVQLHGFEEDAVVEMKPRAGERLLRTSDIVAKIEELGDELALVMFGGVNYYTGQYFDISTITKTAHQVGAFAGFDLAHAAGNVRMELHDWQVDFAVWCSYKYLNAGPGGISGTFVHEKHGNNPNLLRLAGWWGNDESTRFLMERKFVPQEGAGGWQLSNAPILLLAAHRASLLLFDEIGMPALRAKSEQLTAYLAFLLNDLNKAFEEKQFEIITPSNPSERGCQLSILTKATTGRQIFDYISTKGVIGDWRNPNVIRVAPTPLYNSFEEVYQFVILLKEACLKHT